MNQHTIDGGMNHYEIDAYASEPHARSLASPGYLLPPQSALIALFTRAADSPARS